MGIDATNKWKGETERVWGTPIAMDPKVKARVDAIWADLGIERAWTMKKPAEAGFWSNVSDPQKS